MLCYHCMREKGNADICPYCNAPDTPVSEPHHLLPGTVIGGRYTLGHVIGEGGFGITYIGKSNSLETIVAVKEYYPHGCCNRNTSADNSVSVTAGDMKTIFEQGRSRFLREARTLARFQNEPGIVRVIDYVQENNTAYIVMEYLDGINLRQYQKQNSNFDPVELIRMMMPMMFTLEKVHAAGVIHRDISPDNIMMLRNGSLVLMDFGAARDYDGDNRSMSVMLKQGYAPEEQHRRNGEQGPWTDVYGICATIYRLITGVIPVESLDRVYNDTLQPPSAYGVNISPALENTLMYGLAVYKENRCPDMGTLTSLFSQAIDGDDQTLLANAETIGQPQPGVNRYDPPRNRTNMGDHRTGGNSYPPQNAGGYWQPPQQGTASQTGKKTSYAPIITAISIVGAVIVIAAIAIAVMLSSNNDTDNQNSTASSLSSSVNAVDDDSEDSVEMPGVLAMSKEKAIEVLAEKNLTVSEFIETESDDLVPGSVLTQVPKEGTSVDENTKITLYIAKAKETQAPTEKPKEVPQEKSNLNTIQSNSILYCTADTYVSLHSSASTSSSDICKIWRGQSVTYISSTSNWYYVEFDGVTGYAYASYLSFSRPSTSYNSGSIIYANSGIDFLALRDGTDTDSDTLKKIPPGKSMTFQGICVEGSTEGGYHAQWVYVKYGNEYGYVYDYYVHD